MLFKMFYSRAGSLLLSLSIALPVLALPSPEFARRDDCHADNCLRNFKDSRYSSKASSFCSTYITATTTITVQSTITSAPPTVTSTVTGAGSTTTLTAMIDNTNPVHRRDEDDFEEPIEDDLERREIYLDDTLEEDEDIEIQELIRRLNVINETTPTTTTTTTPSPTTTSATATTTTPPLITSPATTSGSPSYASACTVGSTVNPSRVSSACACLIANKAATTTVTATVTSGPAPTTTLTVPGPITTVTATTYSSCSAEYYANYQQFDHMVPASVGHNYTYPNPDPSQHTKDACCNACYGSPNCFAFLYVASDAVLGRGASCRIFGTDHTGNANATLTTSGTGRMCPAGEYYDKGVGLALGVSSYEYGPCDEANAFRSQEEVK